MNKAEYVFNKLAQLGQAKFDITKDPGKGFYNVNAVQKFNTPGGLRFYSGTGSSKDMGMAQNKAIFNARMKSINNPADSTTTQQFNDFNKEIFKVKK